MHAIAIVFWTTPLSGRVDVLRLAAALVLLAWLPGFAWTLAFMPRLTRLTRFVYSIGISVALVTITLFCASTFFHVPLTPILAVADALLLTAVPLVAFYAKRKFPQNKQHP